ncbi:MAG: hypothetical protein LBQ34_07300 [Alphaproteobacteria bacterium]|jgi:uncharacterized phage-associated protein|nr:hypothetical protein [Alphaproteobacteria bacterium]
MNVFHVANAIIEKFNREGCELNKMMLEKHVYYAYGLYWYVHKKRLFELQGQNEYSGKNEHVKYDIEKQSPFEAWGCGAVVKILHKVLVEHQIDKSPNITETIKEYKVVTSSNSTQNDGKTTKTIIIETIKVDTLSEEEKAILEPLINKIYELLEGLTYQSLIRLNFIKQGAWIKITCLNNPVRQDFIGKMFDFFNKKSNKPYNYGVKYLFDADIKDEVKRVFYKQ